MVLPAGRCLPWRQAEPGFYKANRLKIAQCYQRLGKVVQESPRIPVPGHGLMVRGPSDAAGHGQTDEAKKWTSQALGMPVANADDKQAHAETVQLAKQLGMPVT